MESTGLKVNGAKTKVTVSGYSVEKLPKEEESSPAQFVERESGAPKFSCYL